MKTDFDIIVTNYTAHNKEFTFNIVKGRVQRPFLIGEGNIGKDKTTFIIKTLEGNEIIRLYSETFNNSAVVEDIPEVVPNRLEYVLFGAISIPLIPRMKEINSLEINEFLDKFKQAYANRSTT